jgi:hypothetical protein
LTFYYFADAYINFNSLVTDLFKIYKTRIWMSAINPASFASPTLGIQAPSGVGPGAVGVGRSGNNERRQNQQPQQQQQQQPEQQLPGGFATGGQPARGGFRPGHNAPFNGDRGGAPMQAYSAPQYGYGPTAGAFANMRANMSYAQGIPPNVDALSAAGFQQLGDFQSLRNRYPTPGSVPSPTPHSQGISPISPQHDWNAAFQGLSLNSH